MLPWIYFCSSKAISVKFHTTTNTHTYAHTPCQLIHTLTSGWANFFGYFRDAIFVFASFSCFCTCCTIFIACSHIAPRSLCFSLFCCLSFSFCCCCLCTFIDGSYCSPGVLFSPCPKSPVNCKLYAPCTQQFVASHFSLNIEYTQRCICHQQLSTRCNCGVPQPKKKKYNYCWKCVFSSCCRYSGKV